MIKILVGMKHVAESIATFVSISNATDGHIYVFLRLCAEKPVRVRQRNR